MDLEQVDQASTEEVQALLQRDMELAKMRMIEEEKPKVNPHEGELPDPDADVDDKLQNIEPRKAPLQFTIDNAQAANIRPRLVKPVTPEQQAQARAMAQHEAIEQAMREMRERGQQEGIITGIVVTMVVAGLAYGGLWAYQSMTSKGEAKK